MRSILTVVAAVLWMSCAGLVQGQSMNAGDIRGIVTDSSGAAIPDATVTVLNKDTGVTKDFTTNQDGLYDTNSIVPGNYELTFSKTGFQKLVRSAVTVQVGIMKVDAQLPVGAVTESVVVNTDIPLLSTENAEQSTTLASRQLANLPQVGTPTWENFTILLPGAAGAPMGAQGSSNPGQVAAVNGNLPFSTILADGAAITLPHSANADVMIQETIQEVKVSASAFSAQYGIGGIMFNQISKGGTDRFHGSAYEYFQNDAMNAANYAFATKTREEAVSPLRYNNFGFSVGGPIIKRKLFFFFDYDKVINHGAASTGTATVPTAAMLNGDFTGLPDIYDPNTTTVVNGAIQRQTFAQVYGNGNRIPASRLDKVAQAMQQYYPKPNTPGTVSSNGIVQNNYFYNVPNSQPFQRFFGRADWDITGNNRLTMSETASDNPAYSQGQGICPINCQSQVVSRHNAQITDVWTISPNVINELRVAYTNQMNFFVPAALDQGFPGKLGWQFAKADNFPTLNVTGYYQLTPNTNAVYKEHIYDPSDVVTLVKGKHILHFGGEYLFFRDNSTAWGNIDAGTMGFTGAYTSTTDPNDKTKQLGGMGYADFLLGTMNSWGAQVTPEAGARMRVPQMFIQDDYKLTQNLTLNLGLRYQIQSGWGEVKGNMATFDPRVQNPATGTLGAFWYGTTKAGGRDRLQEPVYTTFLPRVGFAWMLDPRTTLRGGFGLYAYNWSLDTYAPGMGQAFGTKGNLSDQSGGVTPIGLLGGTGANLPYIPVTTNPAGYNGSNVNYNQYHAPVGGSYQWNLSMQREISNDMVVELAYVASHGHDLPFPVDINQVPENRLAPNDQQSRPYPQFGNIFGSTNNALSNYNSLQASVNKRLSNGLNFNFNYVWSHFLSNIDSSGWGSRAGAQNYQRSYNPSANYANSNFDIRNAFKGSAIYELPFGRGKRFLNNSLLLDQIVGGWQTAGTLVVQSGQPFTVSMATDNSYSLAQNSQWYPNLIGNPKLSSHGAYHGTNQWFNEAAFATPTPGTFGNAGRNLLNGPGLSNVNFSLGKTFHIWESVNLQIRADARNVFNHPSFGLPTSGGNQGSAQLTVNPDGSIATGTSTIRTLTVNGRGMQLVGRVTF
ncbi:TonB-dependent receptor [Edaphobacter aggregans]|uniref:TonB-dependent receptor n=1 Tax=Edaphobacter aggregans TaxID=570835 RepID=UPI001FE0AD18|nr:TonB-dependent receptor [Edaphobacter aggregans]